MQNDGFDFTIGRSGFTNDNFRKKSKEKRATLFALYFTICSVMKNQKTVIVRVLSQREDHPS